MLLGSRESGIDHHTVEMGKDLQHWTKEQQNHPVSIKNKCESQVLWGYRVASVFLAKLFYTSVMETLMQERFLEQHLLHFVRGNSSIHFSRGQYKTTVCTHYKGMAEEEELTGTGLVPQWRSVVAVGMTGSPTSNLPTAASEAEATSGAPCRRVGQDD